LKDLTLFVKTTESGSEFRVHKF